MFWRHHEKQLDFALGGHTDDVGDWEYNLTLSRGRAEAAKVYLIDKFGISPERIESEGFGEAEPRVDDTTAAARALNRRVVLKLK